MKIEYFNEYIIEDCNDNHLHYLLSFKTVSGKTSYKDGIIDFFTYSTAKDFMNEVLKYQTQFVKDNLLRLELATPNRNEYGHLVSGYYNKDTVFLVCTK